MTRRPLSSDQEALFKNPATLADQSLIKPIKFSQRSIKNYDISGHMYQNLEFDDSEAYGLFIERSKVTHVTFKKGDYNGLFFTDSVLTDVHFNDVTITDLGFGRATLVDVTFQNCTLNAPVFAMAKGHLKFINCTLNAPEFRESQAILTFENSTITNKSDPHTEVFTKQKLPAAIYLKDSHILGESTSGPIIVGGTLTAFKASGGSIVNVGIGDNIKEVDLRHTTLDISTGGSIDNLSVDHSKILRLGIGDTRINQITISDCQTPVNLLSLIDGKFNHLDITNCTIQKFEPWSASATLVDIRNSTLIDANFQDAKLGELLLNNVTIQNINLKNAHAEKVTTDKITLSTNGQVQDAGSNIKLH